MAPVSWAFEFSPQSGKVCLHFHYSNTNDLVCIIRTGIYEVPSDVTKDGKTGANNSGGHSPFSEPVSAILAPSSITHKTSPTLQLKTRKLDPSADTGKDTQQLVEEDKSDCWYYLWFRLSRVKPNKSHIDLKRIGRNKYFAYPKWHQHLKMRQTDEEVEWKNAMDESALLHSMELWNIENDMKRHWSKTQTNHQMNRTEMTKTNYGNTIPSRSDHKLFQPWCDHRDRNKK